MGLLDALTDRRFWSEFGNNVSDLGQSASNAVASNVTAPVDGIAWLLRKAGVQVPEAPIGGSDWAKNAGLLRDVQQSPSSIAGETLGAIAPMLLAAKAPQIARGLLQGADNLMAPTALRKEAGNVFVYPQDAALSTAQRNAALPVSEGGLGLHAENTAMERAKALGFDVDTNYIHSTSRVPSEISNTGRFPGLFATPEYSSGYGTVDVPLLSRGAIASSSDIAKGASSASAKRAVKQEIPRRITDPYDIADAYREMQTTRMNLAKEKGFSGISMEDELGDSVALLPGTRSRFAAFDPMRRNEADLLGRADPELLGLISAGLLGYGGYKALNKQ